MLRIAEDWLDAPASARIFDSIEGRGYGVYFVGGCVRNALMGRPVTDLDLATDARPEEIIKIAKNSGIKAIPTGIDHGTVTLVADGVPFEITTFPADIDTDGRHADVSFTTSLEADAVRRDFTVNAFYASRDGQVLDPVNGAADLDAGVIRFIGDPNKRIQEDYLRILRFFRFYAQYGNSQHGIEANGLAACAEHADQIVALSKERVTAELIKLLTAPDPSLAIASMAASGVLRHSLPGASAQTLPMLVHLEQQVKLAPDPILRLAALGGEIETALRLSKKQILALDAYRTMYPTPEEAGYRLKTYAVGSLALKAASFGENLESIKADIARKSAEFTFPIKANDLMPQLSGPALGAKLVELEDRWIASGFEMTKADLLA